MNNRYEIEAAPPAAFTTIELDDFAALVRKGGKVDKNVRQRLSGSQLLGVVRHDGQIVGTAAIKNPENGYRSDCFAKAGSSEIATAFPYEVGWVFMSERHRDAKRMGPLIAELIERYSNAAIFATTETTNSAMLHILGKHGFTSSGSTYKSKLGNDDLVLLLRQPRV